MNVLGGLLTTAVTRAAALTAGAALGLGVMGVAWGTQDVVLSLRADAAPPVTIEGSASGVVAGAPAAALRLTLRNAGDAAVPLTSVRADVTSGCDARYLAVTPWQGAISVPAHGVATVTLRVAVAADLPDACAHAAWGLLYTAH